jgi:hypothetical protein
MWIGEWPWWISLLVAIVLLPLPALCALWPVSYTPNPRVAATVVITFWVLLEVITLSTKGLTLPWHQDVIRFLIDAAVISGAIWAGIGRSPREFVRIFVKQLRFRMIIRALSRPKEESMQETESTAKEKPAKKSMADTIRDRLNNLKPGEWQAHCRKADAEEDEALGYSAPKDN